MPLRIDRRLVDRYVGAHRQMLTALETDINPDPIVAAAEPLWVTMNSAEKGLTAQLCTDAYDAWSGGQRSA